MITVQQTMDVIPYMTSRSFDTAKKRTTYIKISSQKQITTSKIGGNISVSAFCMQLETYNIHMGRNQMFRWLRDNGYLSKQKSTWNMPLQKHVNQNLLTVKETFILVADEQVAKYSPFITPKGKQHLIEKLKEKSEIKHRSIN